MLYEAESYEDEFDDFYFSQSSTAFGDLGVDEEQTEKIEGKMRSNSFEMKTVDTKYEASLTQRPGSGKGSKHAAEKQKFQQM